MKRKLAAAYFLLYNFIGLTIACGGWLWEVLLFLLKDHQFVNRGFLYGPYLPVYGTGAILLSMLFYRLHAEQIPVFSNTRIFLLCMCGGSLIELCIGWFLQHVFHQKYWDYSAYPLNLNGYICLFSALGFGIFGLIWIKWTAPRLIRAWERVPFSVQILVIGLSDIMLLTDAIFSLMHPNSGRNITFS